MKVIRGSYLRMSSTWLLFVLISLTFALYAHAQSGSVDIANTYLISGGVADSGDIVSFNPKIQQYFLSNIRSDENLFGVVSLEPVFVLYEEGTDGLPVVRTGETGVNVTTANGPITAGDYITSSSISGKGQRADDSDTYIVGIALESFSGVFTEEKSIDGAVIGGVIQVLLSVGTTEKAAAILAGNPMVNTGVTEATVLNIVQYILAAFIAVGSLYVAFRNFGPNIKNGIISVGRNPLAKSSIQSMVILNAVLIILISVGGLLVSLAILLLPI